MSRDDTSSHGHPRRGPRDVPVFVDSVKTFDAFPMTRCNYLSIECDDPRPGWMLNLGGIQLPFLMLGLTGIVQSSPYDDRFPDPHSIEALFRLVEDEAGLLIDIDDLWVPNFLLGYSDLSPGTVLRMSVRAFAAAASFRDGRMDFEEYLGLCRELPEEVSLSEMETAAFREWHARQLETAIAEYPKNSNLALDWEDTNGGVLR